MNIYAVKRVYFLGIGGIGMSALARFFNYRGVVVAGYDRTPTDLTAQLQLEGIDVQFTDDVALVDKAADLVVYTPAIPASHTGLNWYRENNYPVYKRSDVLQWITEEFKSVTVAGTHGKTTISTLIAFLFREAGAGCNAFLGGIAANYNTNYWSSNENLAVIEADEYDRSFLKLRPDMAVLTAMDADHLDIYGTVEAMEEAFIEYTTNIKPGGWLVVKYGLARFADLRGDNKVTYHVSDTGADIYATNLAEHHGGYTFDVVGKGWSVNNVVLPIGGLHNVENTLAALAVMHISGVDVEKVKQALQGFLGIKRRFEYIMRTDSIVYIDDYAHHPAELAALITSAKHLYPNRRCVVCFQPHLFSRTRDLATGFAESLDLADEVLLLDIYPARELPMEGVTSAIIAAQMKAAQCTIIAKQEVYSYIQQNKPRLFITAGAGDIDKMVSTIKNILIAE